MRSGVHLYVVCSQKHLDLQVWQDPSQDTCLWRIKGCLLFLFLKVSPEKEPSKPLLESQCQKVQ